MLSFKVSTLVALLFFGAHVSAAPFMLATDKRNTGSFETYSNSLHASPVGMYSLAVHEEFCELDLSNQNHLDVRNLEFRRRRDAGDLLIAYFFRCEKLGALNAENYQNFERLKVYQFDGLAIKQDADLRLYLLGLALSDEIEVSEDRTAYLKSALDLEGSVVVGHEVTRPSAGDVKLGFSLASADSSQTDTYLSVWLSEFFDVYIVEQTRGLLTKQDWGNKTKQRHMRAVENARKAPAGASVDSILLDEKPNLIPSYFLENVIFYAKEEFKSQNIGSPIFHGVRYDEASGGMAAFIDFDSIRREGDWLYYDRLAFVSLPEPSKPTLNAGTNLVALDLRGKFQVSCSRKLRRQIKRSVTLAENKPLWEDDVARFEESDDMFIQVFEALMCGAFKGDAPDALGLLESVDHHFMPNWRRHASRLYRAFTLSQVEFL